MSRKNSWTCARVTQDQAPKQALPGPAMEAGCLARTSIQSLAYETGILGKCISCMAAQTMVMQLVSVVKASI